MKNKRLDSLHIERFRQIRELTLPSVGQVNLIVGGNNSGKSTLLDALRFFASRASPGILEELLSSHGELQAVPQAGLDALGVGAERALGNLFTGRRFPVRDGEAIYVGDVSKERFVRLEHVFLLEERVEKEVDGEMTSVRRERKVPKTGSEELSDAVDAVEILSSEKPDLFGDPGRLVRIRLAELFARRGLPLARYRNDAQFVELPHSYVPSSFHTHQVLAEAWDDIVLTDGEQLALQSLRIIEPQTLGLAFVQNSRPRSSRGPAGRAIEERVAVLKIAGLDAPVPLQSMGDGMARVLQLVLSALRAGDGLLLVDEIENGLHHSVQVKVWELLFGLVQAKGLQIFATTHSDDCVKAFSKVAIKNQLVDGKLLKMERMTDDGQTVAVTLGEQDLLNLLDAGIEVRG